MKRNKAIETAKCIAVIMMALGHCIGYGTGIENYNYSLFEMHRMDNALFVYIYSFHMPLFALISGYLFWFSTVKRGFKQILQNRINNIIIPLLGWQFLMNIFDILHNVVLGRRWKISILLTGYLSMYRNVWFLWAILICSLIVIVCHYVLRDNMTVYISIIFITFLVKSSLIQMWLWLLPFFVFGYLANKNNWKNILKRNHRKTAIAVNVIVHILCVVFWRADYYIYDGLGLGTYIFKSGSIIYSLFVNLYRIIAGFSGSITWIMIASFLSRYIKENTRIYKFVSDCAKYSIGIYVLNVKVFKTILMDMVWLSNNAVLIIIETIIILALSLLFMKLVDRYEGSRKVLLGMR